MLSGKSIVGRGQRWVVAMGMIILFVALSLQPAPARGQVAPAAAPPLAVHWVLTPGALTVDEGGTATFQVSLDAEPASDVSLVVERLSGDTDLSVSSGTTIMIPRAGWATPHTVAIKAAEDVNKTNDSAIFRVRETSANGIAAATLTATELDNDNAHFQCDVDNLPVPEGGTALLRVWLDSRPTTGVTFTVTRVSGDADLSVAGGSPGTIPAAAWSTPVGVTVAAAADADNLNGTATFRIHATNYTVPDLNVTVRELDSDATGTNTVGGTVSANTSWTTTSKDLVISSTVVVPAGVTLTIGPGVTLRQQGSSFQAFDVSGTLRIQNGARLILYSYTPYWNNTQDRKSGIVLESGGAGDFDRALFQSMETCEASLYGPDHYDPYYWAAIVYATDNARLTARGCRFEGLGRPEGWMTPYGVRMEAAATADVTDSTVTTPAVRTAWRNLRAGVCWVAGTARKRVDPCTFLNCPVAGIHIWGNAQSSLTLVNPDNLVASTNGASLTLKSGCTMTVAPGAALRSAADRWVNVESGAKLVFNHARTDMASPIQVNGRLEANDSSFKCRTYTPYWNNTQDRRNGVVVGDGGQAVFERVLFQPWETNEASTYGVDHNDQYYWAAPLYLTGTSSSTVHGCRFDNLAGTNGWKTPTGVRIDPTANVAMSDSTTTSPAVRNRFNGFQAGIEWQVGTGKQTIARGDFTNCGRNIRLWGTTKTGITLNNVNVVLGTHNGSVLTIQSGGTLLLNPGSELHTRNGKQVVIESGARMTSTNATIYTYGNIQTAGVLALTSTTMVTRTYNPYWNETQNRQNGILIHSGGSATLRTCSFYFSETSDHSYWREYAQDPNWGEWAAMINAEAGAAFSIDRCAFNQAPTPAGLFVTYGIRSATKVNWSVTNCVFARNYVALGLYDLPAAPVFSGNELRDTEVYAIYNPVGPALSATDTYWGDPSGPTHMTNPGGTGGRVSDNVSFGNVRITPALPLVELLAPATGQETSALGTKATALGAELIGFRVVPGASRLDQVAFRLSAAAGGMSWDKLTNFRLAYDANGNGTIDSGETVNVGGPALVAPDGSDLLVTFGQSFTTPASTTAGYILVADLDNLATGNAMTVALDGRYLRTKLASGIESRLGTVRHGAGGQILLDDPTLGQVPDNLNGLPEQTNVALFGFRLLGGGGQVGRIDFQLTGLQDISRDKLAALRLYEDVNRNGQYESSDRLVAGEPTAVTLNGNGTGVITYALTDTSLMPTGRSYLLAADLRNLAGGDSLTVSLGTGNITLAGTATVAGGWTTPARHVVDGALLMAPSPLWAPPANFGASAKNIPLLGFQFIPTGRVVNALAIELSGVYGIAAADMTNVRLYWDRNGNGSVDSGEPLLASGGKVALSGHGGTLTFTGPFTTRGQMIVLADIAGLVSADELTIAVTPADVAVPAGQLVAGSVPQVRLVVGAGPEEGSNKNMKWTLAWRSPGGTGVSGRFNHAGNRVILGYDTGSAWVYDAAANTPLIMLKDHYDCVRYAGFSSDDSAAVTVSRDGAVYIWDLKTSGTLRSAMFSDLLVEYAVPSPDFKKLMVITQGKGMLLDIDTQQRLWEFTPGSATVNAIAYSPDGKWILLGSSDKRAYLLDAASGLELSRFTGHSQAVTGVAFTGDGQTIMTASSDATVQLWRYNTTYKRWMVARSISLAGQNAQAAAVSNDGQRVCMVTGTGDSAMLRMFDGATGLELFELNINSTSGGNWGGTVQNVVFDDAGQRILVASAGKGWAQTACFRVSDGQYLGNWGPQGRFHSDFEMRPRASGDGSRIFYNTDWGMNLLLRQNGKPIRRSPSLPGDFRFGIDKGGTRLAWVQSSRLRVDAVSESGFAPVVDVPFTNWSNVPVSVAPDGTKVAVGDRLFSAASGAQFANYASPDGGYPSAFSNDGLFWGFSLASDHSMVTCLADDPQAALYSMSLTDPYTPFKILYHPDGVRIGCVDRSTGVQMYDMDQDLPAGLYRFDAGDVYDAALSEDGSLLLIGGNNVVKLYDVRTGAVLRYFYPLHSSLQNVAVRSVQFARSDTQIVIGWSYNYVEVYERSQAARLDVTPATRTLARGQAQPFQVEIVYDDSTRRDVTPRPGQSDTSVSLEIVPPTAATVVNNVVTVAAGATGSFTVRARYREDGHTLIGEAVVAVGAAKLVELKADPDRMALTPGVFRPITYTAIYDDGYQTDVTEQVQLSADRPEDVEIAGENVKVLFTARPGQIQVTGQYRDPQGAQASALTTLLTFGPRTEWERYAVTGGGYGTAGSFSPSGGQLAVGSSSGAVNLYTVGATPTQYALTHIILAHAAPLVLVNYLDGADSQLVTVAEDGQIKTWPADHPTSQPLTLYRHDAQIQCAALRCESGQRTLVVGDTLGRVSLIDLQAGRALWTVNAHSGAVRCVALDGDTVLSGGADGRLKIFSRATGHVTATKTVHTRAIVSVGFLTVNGNPGFYTLSEDKTLVRWTKSNLMITGKPYEYPSAPTTAAVIGNTLYVATSSPPATWAYDSNGLLLRWLEHPPAEGSITQLLMTPDGAYLVTGRSTGKKSVALKLMGQDAGEVEVTSPFSSFQFFETGRGIYRGSLAHSFPLAQAHAASTGQTVFTQDPKRTMSWVLGSDSVVTATRLMETGYFIDPHFEGMDFTDDSALLATRVGVSIFMYDTVHDLLWKNLHTPGEGPFTISPGGTRLASADSKTRLWDLANLSMIDENPHLCSGMHFVGESNFLGAIEADRFLGVFDSRNIMVNGATTRHQPRQVFVNRAKDRAIIVSYEVRGGGLFEPKTYDYYVEVYNIKTLTAEPQLLNEVYLFTITEDPFAGASAIPSFAIAVSEDASLALVGASGDRPVKLIQLADGSVIHEFLPPSGQGASNLGASSVEFLSGDRGVMIGWGEGYAELWRRVLPLSIALDVDSYVAPGAPAGGPARVLAGDPNTRIKVVPGQSLRIESSALYQNGDNLNVTPSTTFSTSAPSLVFIDGSLITISPKATPQVVTVSAQYTELGKTLTTTIELEIVGSPIAVTGLAPSGYALDLLDAGKTLYTDAQSTFTQPIPGELLHQFYIRTRAADGNATGAGFVQFTVNQPVRVVVAVDGKMTKLPAWLASWTEMTPGLATTDVSPARRLFQAYFNQGLVSLGANRDTNGASGMRMYSVVITNPDLGQTGSVEVRALPAQAPWRLEGPLNLKIEDTGTTTIANLPTGNYLITWLPLADWDMPDTPQTTAYLARNGRITFAANYARQTGTVVVNATPAAATWRLTDVNGRVTNGKGAQILGAVPTGPVSIFWNPLTGYDAPGTTTETQQLTLGATVSFNGLYLSQTDNVERNMALVLKFLLGLTPQEWWMDVNNDGSVTITDYTYLREYAIPQTPTLLAPANGASSVSTGVTFDWADARYARSYDFYLWKSAGAMPATPTASGLTASSYRPATALLAATNYSWCVKARSRGNESWSPTWTFKTR